METLLIRIFVVGLGLMIMVYAVGLMSSGGPIEPDYFPEHRED